ncbi:response regulator transcription factor [soil metagenome]
MATYLTLPHTPLPQTVPATPSITSAVLAGLDGDAPALIAGLEGEGVHTWSTHQIIEAVGMASGSAPDLIVLGEGLDAAPSYAVPELRRAAPSSRILFLMGSFSARRASLMMALGVDDVVPPPHSAVHVLLRAHVGGLLDQRSADAAIGSGPDRILVDRFSRTVMNREDPASLTAREFELLVRLLEARGRVVARETLLSDIWGQDQDSEAVLDATVHRLRRKLENDHSSPRILMTIRGIGYRLEDSRVGISER